MKKFKETQVTLKNQKTVTLRHVQAEDVEKLFKAITTYIPQSDYIPKFPNEIQQNVKQQQAWVTSFLEHDNALLIVAEYNDQIIGNIDITGHRREAMQHTAVIGMGMTIDWRNVGLGKALLTAAVAWAKENPTLELLWLEVYTANIPAITLYKKMGFVENGVVKGFFKHNKTYFDRLTMSLLVT